MNINSIKVILITMHCFIGIISFAQFNPINSNKIIKEGYELYEKEKYKDAIALYKQVSRSDSNYNSILFNLSLAYYADSNYVESKKNAELGLRLFPEKADEWLGMIANNYDNLGMQKEAYENYDKIIEQYKFPYLAWFNKGVTYYKEKKNEEAKKCFQECVIINPYYGPAHYFLGVIANDEGNLVPAMLSLSTYLLVNPEGKYNSRSIYLLNSIAKVTDDILKATNSFKPASKDNYEEIQDILLSKIALDRQYKLKAELEDPIVRQLQVLFEKLKYNEQDKGFAMQYYVPLFEKVLEDKQFEPLVFFMFSSVKMDEIEKYLKRNKNKINEVAQWYGAYFNDIRATQKLIPAERKNVAERIVYIEGEPFGKGKTEMQGSKTLLVGKWIFYHKNGKIKSEGMLDSKQEKTGEWIFYYESGQMKEKSLFKAGKADGKSLSWYDNGNLMNESVYKEGKIDGKEEDYYYNSMLSRITTYKDGKKEGPQLAYTSSGNLLFKTSYTNDLEEGDRTDYYNTGNVSIKSKYAAGEPTSNFTKYFSDGILSMEGSFANGKRNGTWKEYYNNGKLKSVYTYNASELEGEYKEYYDNGKLMYATTYAKHKIEGKYEDYDSDGKLYSESFYEKGRLKDMKFFDKQGKMIANNTSRNGSGNFVFYDPEGNKTSEGFFTKDGMRSGKSTFYYRNGQIKSIGNYKEGLLEGEKISYYKNGTIAAKNMYKNDDQNGYQVSYYLNGKKRYEGTVIDGYKEGPQLDYDLQGNIYSASNYKKGDFHGYLEYFHPNGKIDNELRFSDGWIQDITQYDTTGKIIEDVNLQKGEGSYTIKNYKGTPFIQSTYKHYNLNGPFNIYFVNGKLNQYYFNKFGLKDSIQKRFYLNGNTEFEGFFKMDEKHGKWSYFHENGKLHYSETFHFGRLNDTIQLFNEEGQLERELPYTEGEYNGDYKIFGDDKKLAVVIKYEDGEVKGYTYEDKNGTLLPVIPLKNGTGKITAYYKNGTKSAEIDFEENEVNGKRNIYYSTGKPYLETTRLDGEDNGVRKVYFPSGHLKRQEAYYFGSLHGNAKEWWDNGKLKLEESFFNGERNGVKKTYDETGKLNQTFTYYFGVLQSIQ